MTGNVSKYALIGGKEVMLLESIPHASSGEVVCVFEDGFGARRFVSEREWDAGAEDFARYASERRFVTSESPGRDKVALFRSLFRGPTTVLATTARTLMSVFLASCDYRPVTHTPSLEALVPPPFSFYAKLVTTKALLSREQNARIESLVAHPPHRVGHTQGYSAVPVFFELAQQRADLALKSRRPIWADIRKPHSRQYRLGKRVYEPIDVAKVEFDQRIQNVIKMLGSQTNAQVLEEGKILQAYLILAIPVGF